MQSEFEKYLKNSNHFADTFNAHRAATAQVIAALVELLVQNHHVPLPALRELLKGLEDASSGPSIDSARRDLVARIGDHLRSR